MSENLLASEKRPIHHLRWWIVGLLFLSTVINYVDRQMLSVLAPFLKEEYQWTNEDVAFIFIAFRTAYAIGQTVFGRMIDRIGTRVSLIITVTWYSTIAMLTSLACGLRSFVFFRFLLGLGESPNWPAATKAASEWFPRKERGLAVGIFDSGSAVASAFVPALGVWLYTSFGHWQPAFLLTGTLGFFWLIIWRWFYYPPESHPRISEAEKQMIIKDKRESAEEETGQVSPQSRPKWTDLMKLPQTWGIIAARALTDPVWFFIAEWLMIYLQQEKGIDPKNAVIAVWIPFLATDLGNLTGGGFSSWLIHRGWPVGKARKLVVVFGAIGMVMLVPTIYVSNLFAIMGLIAVATFSYACFCTMALALPSDVFKSNSVASVSGISGTAASVLTIAATLIIGKVSEEYSFKPIMIASSIVPVIGAILVLWLIRNPKTEDEKGILRRI